VQVNGVLIDTVLALLTSKGKCDRRLSYLEYEKLTQRRSRFGKHGSVEEEVIGVCWEIGKGRSYGKAPQYIAHSSKTLPSMFSFLEMCIAKLFGKRFSRLFAKK